MWSTIEAKFGAHQLADKRKLTILRSLEVDDMGVTHYSTFPQKAELASKLFPSRLLWDIDSAEKAGTVCLCMCRRGPTISAPHWFTVRPIQMMQRARILDSQLVDTVYIQQFLWIEGLHALVLANKYKADMMKYFISCISLWLSKFNKSGTQDVKVCYPSFSRLVSRSKRNNFALQSENSYNILLN